MNNSDVVVERFLTIESLVAVLGFAFEWAGI
jgi:hypothetical protein